jgi:hypothetical protein
MSPLCGTPDAGVHIPPIVDAAVPSFDCHVELSKLSYDSPGADAAEFLELVVMGRVESHGARATLADCGLDTLQLVNGADAACGSYRQIPVGDRSVPSDGYFLLCAADAQAALGVSCDLTEWGRSKLAAGWLQNGPSDGLRLVGSKPRAYSYEGLPASCTGEPWIELPLDVGEASDGSDDVLAACNGEFALRRLAEAPLRTATHCSSTADAAPGTIADPEDPTQVAPDPGPTPISQEQDGGSLEILDESSTAPTNVVPVTPDAEVTQGPVWTVYGQPLDGGTGAIQAAPKLSGGCQIGSHSSVGWTWLSALIPLLALGRRRSGNLRARQ